MGDYQDYEESMSVAGSVRSSVYTGVSGMSRHDPGKVMTHQAAQEWSDPEMLRQCPFDKVHVVQAYRYQRHVLRCRKQNPEKAKHFAQCKFNAMHFFRKEEMEQHEAECPDRNRAENTHRANVPATKSITDKIYVATDWEEELESDADTMIRPSRETILKLKKVLREKYGNNEQYRNNPFKN